jgi:hypothetical protein
MPTPRLQFRCTECDTATDIGYMREDGHYAAVRIFDWSDAESIAGQLKALAEQITRAPATFGNRFNAGRKPRYLKLAEISTDRDHHERGSDADAIDRHAQAGEQHIASRMRSSIAARLCARIGDQREGRLSSGFFFPPCISANLNGGASARSLSESSSTRST